MAVSKVTAMAFVVALCPFSSHGADMCTPDNAAGLKVLVNQMIDGALPTLNSQWPSIVANAGLDPWTPVTGLEYSIGGSARDACDAVCGAQLASCHAFELKLASATIHHLSGLTWKDAEVSKVTTSDSSKNLTNCNLQAEASVDASASLSVDLDVISNGGGLRVYCKDIFTTWSELLWKGKGTCTGSAQDAQASITLQGATCDQPASSDIAAIDSAHVDWVHFNLNNLDCSFDEGDGIPYLPLIVSAFDSSLFSDLVKDLQPTVADALSSAIKGALPSAGIPSQCRPSALDILV